MKTTTSLFFIISFLLFIHPVSAQLQWVPFQGAVPENVVEGGAENNKPAYICLYSDDVRDYLGMVIDGECYYWDEGEQSANTFDILVSEGEQNYDWTYTEYGDPPGNAFVAGYQNDQPIYLGRVEYQGNVFTGEVSPLDEGYQLSYPFAQELYTWAEGYHVLTTTGSAGAIETTDELGVDDPEIGYDDEEGGSSTLLWIMLVAVLAAAAYYFFRKKSVTAAPVAPVTTSRPVTTTPRPTKPPVAASEPVATKEDVMAIKMLINEGELDRAADRLLKLLKEKSSDAFNEIVEYNAQLNELKQKEDLDRIAPDDASRSRSRIRGAMLRMLDRLSN